MQFKSWGGFMLPVVTIAIASSAFAGPPIPALPAPVIDVLHAQPFTIEQAFEHTWRADRKSYTAGYLLVLKVNPDLVFPRQTEEPVLYVGNQTAQRPHVGYPSGKIVVIVPGEVDLTKDAIWFGAPALPENIDAKAIARERSLAEKNGIKPLTADKVKTLVTEKPAPIKLQDWADLMNQVGDLIEKYIPEQIEQAESFRSK